CATLRWGRPRKGHRPAAKTHTGSSAIHRVKAAGSPGENRKNRVVAPPVGIKGIGYLVLLLAFAAIATLSIIAYLMPAQTVRDAVQAEIRAVTGLNPVLRGGASVSLFPTGRVSLDNVSLSDSTGTSALTAELVLARLRFFPLLLGRVEISEITLHRPVI